MKEIEGYLPAGWEEKAKETGALIRGRVIKTPRELLALNMLYMDKESSFGMTAAAMTITKGIKISKIGAYERIKNSGEWLRWMAEELCRTQGAMVKKPEILGEREIIIPDGSAEAVKGGKQTDYRLHYALDLFGFRCRHMEITSDKEGERLSRYEVRETDIYVADRGYCTITGIEHVRKNEGNYVIRYRAKAFNLYDADGKRIELLREIRGLEAFESTEIQGYYRVQSGEMRPIRIVAMKKDEKAIAESKRKMTSKKKKRQKSVPTKETMELNEYIILVTSLEYTKEQILEIYRARWQIEMVFQRLKTLFGYGDVPGKKEETVKAWFYGKLFLAALCESIMKRESFSP